MKKLIFLLLSFIFMACGNETKEESKSVGDTKKVVTKT